MRFLELRIPPVALVILFGAAMAGLARVVPASIPIPLPFPAKLAVAVGLAVIGMSLALAGVVAFRRQKTTVNPLTPRVSSSLVATGIYRFSRNPMYLGFLLLLAGWGVYLANWVAALLLPVFIAHMNRFQIQPEERSLTERFGSQFLDYSQSVRRWL